MAQMSDDEIKSHLRKILESSDLHQMTRKNVRKRLENELNINLSTVHYKELLKREIQKYVQSKQDATDSPNNSNANPISNANATGDASQNNNNNNGNGNDYNSNSNGNSNSSNNAGNNSNINNNRKNGRSFDGAIDEPNNKRRRLNGQQSRFVNEDYNNNNDRYGNNNNNNNNFGGMGGRHGLIKRAEDGNRDSYYVKVPNGYKRIVMHKFRGKTYIGFREYYVKGNEELPTKKGVNFSLEQWEFIKTHLPAIQQKLDQLSGK